jgi:hypothetical protein
MAVSKRTRYEVMRRDNYQCRYCRSTDNPLTVDHVTPVALGGSDDPSNLVAACKDCNAGKASSSPDAETVAQVEEDALRWAAAVERAAQMRRDKRAADRKPLQEFHEYWAETTVNADLPLDWEASIARFLDRGLSMGDLKEAVDITFARVSPYSPYKYFRYFAGVCWNMLRDLQAEAERILTEEAQPSA